MREPRRIEPGSSRVALRFLTHVTVRLSHMANRRVFRASCVHAPACAWHAWSETNVVCPILLVDCVSDIVLLPPRDAERATPQYSSVITLDRV